MVIINEEYLDFIRHQPCIVNLYCDYWDTRDKEGNIISDPHHIDKRGYKDYKRNDYHTVPLCRKHHSEEENLGKDGFPKKHNLDIWREQAYLRTKFDKGL